MKPLPKRESNIDDSFMPIKALNSFLRDWIIKARVSVKGPLRNTSKGGSLFNIELVDSYATQIKATFFNSAAEKFYSMLEENKVYTFSDGQIKVANKRFS